MGVSVYIYLGSVSHSAYFLTQRKSIYTLEFVPWLSAILVLALSWSVSGCLIKVWSYQQERRSFERVKTHKLWQVCKVVTSLFTSCQQVVFALLVPRGCLHESGLSFNPDRTHSVSVEIIGDWIIFVYMNPDWVATHSGRVHSIFHSGLNTRSGMKCRFGIM